MFCVECGMEGKIYDGLCAECYLKKRKLIALPEVVDVQVCAACYAVRIGKSWMEVPNIEKAIELAISSAIEKHPSVDSVRLRLSIKQRDPRNYLAKVQIDFTAGELNAMVESDTAVRLKKDTCQRCGKKSGHYYEAILQLRGPSEDRRPDRLKIARDLAVSRIDKLSHDSQEIFISKEEKIHGGYDLYVSSNSVTKAIAKDLTKMFGASSKSSVSMAGRKDGIDLTRTTYLVRLPDYEPGDILLIEGRYYCLKSVEGTALALLSLDTWAQTSTTIGKLKDLRTIKRQDNVREVQLVSESERELQILDPETYKVIDVVKPEKLNKAGSPILIFKTENKIFLVP